MRLTQENEFFEYVLPCQNVVGDNQATEISLGETEYSCKKYIIGEAINKLGELEDILESWHIENLEELKIRLHDCQVYHLKNNSNETLIHNLKNELAEKERQYETLYKLFSEQHEIIDQNELECFEEVNRLLKEQKDFYVVEKTEYDKMKQGAKDIVKELKQQLAEKEKYTYSGKEVGKIEQYYENLLAEKEKEIRKKVCDDVIKFMEEDGFDCSDWLDLFNLIS